MKAVHTGTRRFFFITEMVRVHSSVVSSTSSVSDADILMLSSYEMIDRNFAWIYFSVAITFYKIQRDIQRNLFHYQSNSRQTDEFSGHTIWFLHFQFVKLNVRLGFQRNIKHCRTQIFIDSKFLIKNFKNKSSMYFFWFVVFLLQFGLVFFLSYSPKIRLIYHKWIPTDYRFNNKRNAYK